MSKKSEREGRLYSLNDLWKLERQLDAIQNHTRIALSILRKDLAKEKVKQGRLYKPTVQGTLEEAP